MSDGWRGRPRYWQLLVAGWAIFAVSFVLPAAHVEINLEGVLGMFADEPLEDALPGWKAFGGALRLGGLLASLSALGNAVMLFAFVRFGSSLLPSQPWVDRLRVRARVDRLKDSHLVRLCMGAALLSLYWPLFFESTVSSLGIELASLIGSLVGPVEISGEVIEGTIADSLSLGIGYWMWAASFFCVVVALHLHARDEQSLVADSTRDRE